MFKNIDLRKSFMLVIALGFIQPLMASPDDFTFTVDTQLGTGATFTIPTYGTGYNYDVDCDTDGSYEATGQTGNYTCDYNSMGGSGVYTIQIKDAIGDDTGFPRVRFNDLGEANEIIELNKWGSGVWETMDSTFEEAVKMTVIAKDIPDFSVVNSMKDMFHSAALADPDTSNWNTANVKFMNSMFKDALLANPDTSNWDTGQVENMTSMFTRAVMADPDTSNWDTANVQFMNGMFWDASVANPDTSGWETANVTSMYALFFNAALANPDTSGWDTTQVTDMRFMFHNAGAANPTTSSWDITAVTRMEGMFIGVTLPSTSYDAMLVGFSSQTVQSGVEFDGGNSKYCASAERDDLINIHGWIITDGGLDPLCDDIIFRNSFELPVVVFNASEKQFSFDFALLNSVEMDSYPELIAVGYDVEQQKVIEFHVRKIAEQMQIRISDLDQDAFEEDQWINQDWQNITNDTFTTIIW